MFVHVLMFVLSMYPWGTTDRTGNSPEEEEPPISSIYMRASYEELGKSWKKWEQLGKIGNLSS